MIFQKHKERKKGRGGQEGGMEGRKVGREKWGKGNFPYRIAADEYRKDDRI